MPGRSLTSHAKRGFGNFFWKVFGEMSRAKRVSGNFFFCAQVGGRTTRYELKELSKAMFFGYCWKRQQSCPHLNCHAQCLGSSSCLGGLAEEQKRLEGEKSRDLRAFSNRSLNQESCVPTNRCWCSHVDLYEVPGDPVITMITICFPMTMI